MSEIDPAWLSTVFAKHSRDNSIVKVISIKTEPAVGVGDNYGSFILRATMEVVLGSGKISKRNVILKTGVNKKYPDLAPKISFTFLIEGNVYNNFLLHYENLIKDNGISYDKIWPECFHTTNDLIIFEDLKLSGFKLASRKSGLDINHAKLVFKNLARLHSLSLVAISKGLVCSRLLTPFLLAESTLGENLYKTSLTALADVIRDSWTDEWKYLEVKIRNMSDNSRKILTDLSREKHKLSVINHGDCWVNNIMFKYGDSNTPIEMKFVDFQITHYNSYAWDLSYFLHTSIHPKYFPDNYDSFIETYTEEFSLNLKRFNFDPSIAPTVDEVKQELIRLQMYSLASACSVLPIIANPSDIKIGLDEILEDSSKFKELYQDKKFEIILKDMFKHFSNLGII